MNTGRIDYEEQIQKLEEKNFNYNFSITNDGFYYVPAGLAFILLFIGFLDLPVSLFLLTFIVIPITASIVFIPYYKSNKGMSVYLTRGKDEFLIMQNGETAKYDKKNIFRIYFYYSGDGLSDHLFALTPYMKIVFLNGEQIILNTFTLDRNSMQI